MRVSEELLKRAEEFFDLIACTEDDIELNSAMDSLRRLLESDVDGWTHHSQENLVIAAQNRVEEIRDLLPNEAEDDADLNETFHDFIDLLETMARSEGQEPGWEIEI